MTLLIVVPSLSALFRSLRCVMSRLVHSLATLRCARRGGLRQALLSGVARVTPTRRPTESDDPQQNDEAWQGMDVWMPGLVGLSQQLETDGRVVDYGREQC